MELVTVAAEGVSRLTLAPSEAQVCISDDDSELPKHNQELHLVTDPFSPSLGMKVGTGISIQWNLYNEDGTILS